MCADRSHNDLEYAGDGQPEDDDQPSVAQPNAGDNQPNAGDAHAPMGVTAYDHYVDNDHGASYDNAPTGATNTGDAVAEPCVGTLYDHINVARTIGPIGQEVLRKLAAVGDVVDPASHAAVSKAPSDTGESWYAKFDTADDHHKIGVVTHADVRDASEAVDAVVA